MSNSAHPYTWPGEKLQHVPFGIFTDEQVYQDEQERIFRGRAWSYLCLEAEIPLMLSKH